MSGPAGSSRSTLNSPESSTAPSWFTFTGLLKFLFFGVVCALAIAAARTYAIQKGGLTVAGVDVLSGTGGLGTFDRQSAKRF